jgi:hypothetical protein
MHTIVYGAKLNVKVEGDPGRIDKFFESGYSKSGQ